LNPNALTILRYSGFVYNMAGDHEKALALYERSLRFGSLDEDVWSSYLGIALVHFFAGRPSEALRWINKAFAVRPEHGIVGYVKIAAMATADEPQDRFQEFIRGWLGTRSPPPISAVRERMSAFRVVDVELLVAALRKAGLPE
jgi:tetratricopeptide (TPR) repeat protein